MSLRAGRTHEVQVNILLIADGDFPGKSSLLRESLQLGVYFYSRDKPVGSLNPGARLSITL